MASIINASTAGVGGVITTADNTGILNIQTAGTTAITVDASQNVGVGTTSPTQRLSLSIAGSAGATNFGLGNNTDASGAVIQYLGSTFATTTRREALEFYMTGANTKQIFYTNGTERMRIDASGRFLVGVTSPVGSCFSTFQYDSGTYNGLALNTSSSVSGSRFMLFASAGTQCGVIDRIGTTSAVVYTATSDRRLKENIVDAPSAIAHINAVKVRSYNWIDGGHQVKYGVIAQEFFDVEPDAVVQGDTGETIEKTWSVDTSALVPAMIKAMQEQQALIENLTTRLSALENK
jgi:hypothetical protein